MVKCSQTIGAVKIVYKQIVARAVKRSQPALTVVSNRFTRAGCGGAFSSKKGDLRASVRRRSWQTLCYCQTVLDQIEIQGPPRVNLASQKLSELGALTQINVAVSRQMRDVQAALRRILEQACRLVSTDHGSVVLVNPKTQFLQIVAVLGADWTPEKKACALGFSEGITGTVAATARPYICDNTQTDPYYYPLFENVRSEMAIPFFAQGRVVGLLNFDSPRCHAFSPRDLAVIAAQFPNVPAHA